MNVRAPVADDAAGFTLVEVLVAFTIVVLLMTAVLQVFSRGVAATGKSELVIEATLLAQSALESFAAGRPLVPGDTIDRVDETFTRRISVKPRDDGRNLAARPRAIQPFEIEVTVSWSAGRRDNRISLQTIQLAPRP
jgi:general secretion pathway protein I